MGNVVPGESEPVDTGFSAGLLDFAKVWAGELNAISPDSCNSNAGPWEANEDAIKKRIDALAEPLSALCLSGGGIRSASFALGVLQALARFGLLHQFHYLSTVSGGGYIGSWLTAWRAARGDYEVMAGLKTPLETHSQPRVAPEARGDRSPEADEIIGIRADSNYLTPRLGFLSADTWTVIVLYIRNLVLNWLIYAPFFLSLLLLPRVCQAIVSWAGTLFLPEYVDIGLMVFGGLILTGGLAANIYSRHAPVGRRVGRAGYLGLVLFPTLVATIMWTLVTSMRTSGTSTLPWVSALPGRFGVWLGIIIYAVSWLAARIVLGRDAVKLHWLDFLAWVFAGPLVGALGLWVLQLPMETKPKTVFGLSLVILVLSLGELVYVGLESNLTRAEEDREWLARSSGWLFATAMAWAMAATVSLYGPDLLHLLHQQWGHWLTTVTVGSAGISGALTLILGWSKRTVATVSDLVSKWQLSLMQIASVAALVFALTLTVLFSGAAEWVETLALNCGCGRHATVKPPGCLAIWDLGIMVSLLVVVSGISRAININRFSMHALYRNRLIRAFLGSSRIHVAPRRNPDPFTGFDFKDNQSMANMAPVRPARLFHVINTALNLVGAGNPAWQERKASSFTITPLTCGNERVGYRSAKIYGGEEGISLGTAMAISGAAVSPNQGYSSSPLVSILLMLFNIRLGWWLGNPSSARSYRYGGPTFGLIPALKELTGQTTDTGNWIYLSDGGHFENLGMYEMVRRRCRFIVVSDAGCDPHFTFEDLGNAARKCYIDMGVSIRFEKLELKARQNPPIACARLAIGSIHYPDDDRPGVLIYLKPTFCATNEPPDVRSYAAFHAEFPHESTAEQWFTESQLESYRALGAHTMELICTGGAGCAPSVRPGPLTLSRFEAMARKLYDAMPAPPEGRFRRHLAQRFARP